MNNKTIEVEGKIYEIGKYYLFRDEDYDEWIIDELLRVYTDNDNDNIYRFETHASIHKQIRVIEPNMLGTVEDKPIELIDGEAYVFDYRGESNKGVFDAESERFFYVASWVVAHACTNIRRLVEEK